ncbi:hypothetical protein C0989_001897 [Termitomyces sp. Mn162]|nr:hypothetical protein C0989_001897 [Termitomyces sp. Mn162]
MRTSTIRARHLRRLHEPTPSLRAHPHRRMTLMAPITQRKEPLNKSIVSFFTFLREMWAAAGGTVLVQFLRCDVEEFVDDVDWGLLGDGGEDVGGAAAESFYVETLEEDGEADVAYCYARRAEFVMVDPLTAPRVVRLEAHSYFCESALCLRVHRVRMVLFR